MKMKGEMKGKMKKKLLKLIMIIYLLKKVIILEYSNQFKHLDIDSDIKYTYNQIINNIYDNNYNPIQEYNYINGYLWNNFNGEYYLDCIDDNCMNINGIIYNVDNRRTRNELYYNTIIKNNIEKVILYQKENINLINLLYYLTIIIILIQIYIIIIILL